MTGRRLDRKPSLTAQFNAAQRAAETLQPPGRRLLNDPHSRYFVRHPALRAILTHRLLAGAALQLLDRLWGGLHAHNVLRVRYTDDVCETAISDGIDQLVLLGAGFDTTSLRRARAPAVVFEVDAPPTQQHKRTVYERLPLASRNCQTVWVPCDFENDSLRERLLANGFDPTRPGLIVWLGVIPYLTRRAIDTTLADLEALCAPGSRLVLDYIDADVITGHTQWKSARRVARAVARRGEPCRTGLSASDLDASLAAHGFECREHARVPALLQRYDPTHARRLAHDDWLAIALARRV